ncbi:MAG: hypothetical protein ACREHD_05530, partial [Pirellulales bacterium]
ERKPSFALRASGSSDVRLADRPNYTIFVAWRELLSVQAIGNVPEAGSKPLGSPPTIARVCASAWLRRSQSAPALILVNLWRRRNVAAVDAA